MGADEYWCHVMNKISKSLSERFAVMSFLCACMIVFFHATPAPDVGSLNWWFFHLFGREGVCCIAVPYFFACSGFFLAGHLGEKGWWRREVSKRVRSLVIPFFIWMAIGFAFGVCVVYAKNRFFNAHVTSEFLALPFWEKSVLYLGLHPFRDIGVLWYVRTLFLMVLVSPVIFRFLRCPISTLCTLLIIHLVVTYLFGTVLNLGMYFLMDRFVSVRGLLYFFVGAALRINWQMDKSQISTRVGLLWLVIGLALLLGKSLLLLGGQGALGGVVEAVAVPCLVVGVWSIVPTVGWMKRLSGYSFPIFLMHNILLSLIAMIFMAIGLRDSSGLQIMIAVVRAFLAIVGSVFLAFGLKRAVPRFASILFGGR